MAKKMRTLPILVLCALVALFVASVLPTSVANAQEKPQFFAKTDDGVNWELYLDGEKLDYASASGKFVDYNNPSAVSAVFFKAIEKELVARGIIDAAHGNLNEYYDIEFGFPSLPAPTTDVASAPYSESREITFFADCEAVVGGASEWLQYRSDGGEYQDANSAVYAGGLALCAVPVGTYEVRYVMSETFSFDGATRTAVRYSVPVTCTIEKATLQKPVFDVVETTYGTSLSSVCALLKEKITDENMLRDGGRFVVGSNQTDATLSGVDENSVLSAKDGYTVLFDFISQSGNYADVKDIEVEISVSPRPLYVYISDVFSLVGEPLVPLSEIAYDVDASGLVNGDDVESAGVYLYYSDDIDNSVSSNTYRVYAGCENKNYYAVSRNKISSFVDGGRYVVYPKEVQAVAPDGRVFVVFADEGFSTFKTAMVYAVDVIDVTAYESARALSAYRVVLTDNSGNPVEPSAPYYVAWTSVPDGAKWVAVQGENALLPLDALSSRLEFDTVENVVVFYCEVKQEVSVWTPANVALVSACCVLALVTAVLVSVFLARNANKDKKRFDGDAYVRIPPCVEKNCNPDEVQPQNAVKKKARHGKNNKQKRAQSKKDGESDQ